ncbi:hypothetical protein [Corynebacterium mayonis]|uniref:hypothetical protein n=1 Tax=Corynebacterium mayonis TaxID=3062461 RepID=UPI003140B2C8
MASDFWQVPVADLETIQANLTSLSDGLDSVEQGAQGVKGVDDIHGHVIESAVSDFFADWKASRRVLIENVEKLGDVSGSIAQVVSEFDSELGGGIDQMGAALRGEEV